MNPIQSSQSYAPQQSINQPDEFSHNSVQPVSGRTPVVTPEYQSIDMSPRRQHLHNVQTQQNPVELTPETLAIESQLAQDYFDSIPFFHSPVNMAWLETSEAQACADPQLRAQFPVDRDLAFDAIKNRLRANRAMCTAVDNRLCQAIEPHLQPKHYAIIPANTTTTSEVEPETLFEQLIALRTPLQTLMLREARPDFLSYLPYLSESLTGLDLDDCVLSSSTASQAYGPQGVDHFQSLNQLTNLQRLSIAQTSLGVSTCTTLGSIASLTALRLAKCIFRPSIYKSISQLSHLQELKLPHSTTAEGPAMPSELAQLSSLSQLTALDLSDTGVLYISDLNGLTGLPQLESLTLNKSGCFDQYATETLAKFSHLRALSITHVGLGNDQVDQIIQAQNPPTLTRLDLRNNSFDNTAVARLGQISTLETLRVEDNSQPAPQFTPQEEAATLKRPREMAYSCNLS